MFSRYSSVVAVLLTTTVLVAVPGQAQREGAKPNETKQADRPPAGAYVRQLGNIPPQRSVIIPDWAKSKRGFAAMEPKTAQSIRGIPLGGIGAGSFQINQNGTFGPWSFGSHEMRILPQAAFHVRTEAADGKVNVRTLATDGPLGNLPDTWQKIDPGQATYSAMYPFGWIDYHGLGATVGMRFWSPIVAGEERRTSMPVAYFDVTAANPHRRPVKVSVMFTFPNAPVHVAGSGKENWMTQQAMHVPQSIRTGLQTRYEKSDGIEGVTLAAADPSNTVDAENTSWTVAAKPMANQEVSYVTSWDGEGNGSDIADTFARSGNLPNRALDKSASAGAISVTVTLKPGERTTIPFVLAWDVPREVYTVSPKPPQPANPFRPAQPAVKGGETVWMKRYTEYFGARIDDQNNYIKNSYLPQQSFRIARESLLDRDGALSAVEQWWSKVATNKSYPAWLRGAALNQTAYLTFGHSFWALGLQSDTVGARQGRRLGSEVPGTHPFFVDTGAEGADETTMNGDVGPYAYLATQLLFPQVERDILLTQGELLRRSDVAQLHNLGITDGGSPFVVWGEGGGDYHMDRTILFAVRWWRYVDNQNDDEMFRWLYPTMVKTWQRHKANFFRDGSNLPFDPSHQANSHDMLKVHGHGVYNSALWLLFEELMMRATERGVRLNASEATPEFLQTLCAESKLAKSEFETAFWDEKRGYYRFDTGNQTPYSDGLFAEAFYGQHLSNGLGLGELVNAKRLRRHLHSVNRILVVPFKQKNGLPIGAANLSDGNGKLYGGLNIGESFLGEAPDGREAWAGAGYPLAALMIAVGKKQGDKKLVAAGTSLGQGISHIIWQRPDLGYAFQAPEAWAAEDPSVARNPSYLRPLSIWDLVDTIAPVSAAKTKGR